jgi:hypothetical protein
VHSKQASRIDFDSNNPGCVIEVSKESLGKSRILKWAEGSPWCVVSMDIDQGNAEKQAPAASVPIASVADSQPSSASKEEIESEKKQIEELDDKLQKLKLYQKELVQSYAEKTAHAFEEKVNEALKDTNALRDNLVAKSEESCTKAKQIAEQSSKRLDEIEECVVKTKSMVSVVEELKAKVETNTQKVSEGEAARDEKINELAKESKKKVFEIEETLVNKTKRAIESSNEAIQICKDLVTCKEVITAMKTKDEEPALLLVKPPTEEKQKKRTRDVEEEAQKKRTRHEEEKEEPKDAKKSLFTEVVLAVAESRFNFTKGWFDKKSKGL